MIRCCLCLFVLIYFLLHLANNTKYRTVSHCFYHLQLYAMHEHQASGKLSSKEQQLSEEAPELTEAAKIQFLNVFYM